MHTLPFIQLLQSCDLTVSVFFIEATGKTNVKQVPKDAS